MVQCPGRSAGSRFPIGINQNPGVAQLATEGGVLLLIEIPSVTYKSTFTVMRTGAITGSRAKRWWLPPSLVALEGATTNDPYPFCYRLNL